MMRNVYMKSHFLDGICLPRYADRAFLVFVFVVKGLVPFSYFSPYIFLLLDILVFIVLECDSFSFLSFSDCSFLFFEFSIFPRPIVCC